MSTSNSVHSMLKLPDLPEQVQDYHLHLAKIRQGLDAIQEKVTLEWPAIRKTMADIDTSVDLLAQILESNHEALKDSDEALKAAELEVKELQDTEETQKDTIRILEEQLEEAEEGPRKFYNSLHNFTLSYNLSNSQYYQDEILKLLRDEFDLHLIVAPASNA